MLEARSIAEAHLYLAVHGLELIDIEVHDHEQLLRCVSDADGTEETLIFYVLEEQGDPLFGGPEPSTLLTPEEFAAWARTVEQMIPPSPRGLVRDAVWAAHQELIVGLEALDEARRRAPSTELDALRQQLQQRLEAYAEALPLAPGSRPVAAFVDEPPGLLDSLQALVDEALPLQVRDLLEGGLGPFSLVGSVQGRLLLRHPRGPVLWASLQGDAVESLELVGGEEAVVAWQTWGMELSAPASVRVREAMRPGRPVGEALAEAFPEPDLVQPLARVPGETEHLYFYLAQTDRPLRAVVLAVRGDLEGHLLGHLVLQDQAAAEQYARLAEALGPPADAQERAEALAKQVAELAHPVAWSLLHAEGVRAVQPRPLDYARVFPEHGPQVRAVYEALWAKQTPELRVHPTWTELLAWACPAGLLDEPVALSADFPDSLVGVARYLAPELIWVAWRYQHPKTGEGRDYLGLVWVDDHWAWFPKPWAVLRKIGL